MTAQFKSISPGAALSDQVADALVAEIKAARIHPGDKLPTEAALAAQFQVSRTVVREAVSRLKSLGLVDSRQGSGVYVKSAGFSPLNFDARHAVSKQAVIQMVEVRRALEAEVAGLAAQRRSKADVKRIRQCIQALDKAVRAGGDGVDEDVQYHRAIAETARNPFLIGTLEYLGQFLRGATRVTRANEARRADFARQVKDEHDMIYRAIEAGDAAAARQAAAQHMNNAILRIEQADPAFWQQAGVQLAHPLVSGLSTEH
ncbi:MAG: FadR family transcriptional regulator [Gammaproteobacteria bacterium]|nr:FadR family transcriptional regulator [Gammaproteobacteria bacterium]MBU0787235.1 FadR family transcriptional regulator [Gammaproteobacteria bacterium]MBU0815975.1 FadR family transcriptional regulator [Gammaproteobacteria bacterium]MBU1787514.1 FadR family transcriptional regulator [Gammaproteobacteria bacterium]